MKNFIISCLVLCLCGCKEEYQPQWHTKPFVTMSRYPGMNETLSNLAAEGHVELRIEQDTNRVALIEFRDNGKPVLFVYLKAVP